MNCPKCQHEHFVKNGHVNEKQRYKCKDCNYQWTEHHTHRGRPLAERALAVFLYCHGLSMNAIAKILRASPSTILQWIRDFANQHAQPPEPETDTVVLELDEMWHYLKKKSRNRNSVQTKKETHRIERNNCRMRHWFGRFKRKSIIVSKSVEMVNVTVALFAKFRVNGDVFDILKIGQIEPNIII